MRSELGIKFDEWVEKTPKAASAITHNGYLKNLFERAFIAGAEANEQVNEEICEKLMAPFL